MGLDDLDLMMLLEKKKTRVALCLVQKETHNGAKGLIAFTGIPSDQTFLDL